MRELSVILVGRRVVIGRKAVRGASLVSSWDAGELKGDSECSEEPWASAVTPVCSTQKLVQGHRARQCYNKALSCASPSGLSQLYSTALSSFLGTERSFRSSLQIK